MPLTRLELQQKISRLSLRERALLLLSILAAIFIFWQLLLQDGLSNQGQTLQTQLSATVSQRQELERKITELTALAANDQNLPKKSNIAELKAELAALDMQLSESAQGLVRAEQLPKILQDVLLRTGDLELIQMRMLPVEELTLMGVNPAMAQPTAQNGQSPQTGTGVFKHSVELRVSGSYFQVLRFLQSLESYQWRFYWDRLDYDVTQYPRADIQLRVYTLTAEEGLLGV